MEEAQLAGQRLGCAGEAGIVERAGQGLAHVVGRRHGLALAQVGEEGRRPEVAGSLQAAEAGITLQLLVRLLFSPPLVNCPFGHLRDMFSETPQVEQRLVEGDNVGREGELASPFLAVASLDAARLRFLGRVVALVCLVGDTIPQYCKVEDADQRVAALDPVVEEGERLAGDMGLDPERDLAEFDGQWVLIDGVEAVGNDVAQGFAHGLGRWFLLAGANPGQLASEPAGSGQQEVAGAGGWIADLEGEDHLLLLVFGLFAAQPGREHWLERTGDQLAHEFRRGVVGAGRLALETLPLDKAEWLAGGKVEDGGMVEQALVDGAELLDVERRVVNASHGTLLVGQQGEAGERVEEGAVGEPPCFEWLSAEEVAVEHRQVEPGGQRLAIGLRGGIA